MFGAGGPALFEESQRFFRNPWAVLAAVGGLAGGVIAAWALGAAGDPFHLAALFGLAVGGGVAALLAACELRTAVRPDGLYLRFFPFTREHRFAWQEIARAEARSYRPLLEYGGWGIRWGRAGKAYNVHGTRGVQLELRDGRRLLIGSQRAEALAAAIEGARGA